MKFGKRAAQRQKRKGGKDEEEDRKRKEATEGKNTRIEWFPASGLFEEELLCVVYRNK